MDLETIQAWFKEDRDFANDWRDEAREDFAFASNDQWSDDDKALLEEQLRPCITFDRIGPVVDAVSGAEVSNRQEVRFIPREQGDAGVNELFTGAAQWFRDQCDAEDEESDAFRDTIICGMGWTETRLDYEEEQDGKPLIGRVDPLEMLWDASARKRNISDARRVWRVRQVSFEEASAQFPDHDWEELHAAWADDFIDDASQPHDADDAPFYRSESDGAQNESKRLILVELQWWEREPFHRVIDPTTGQAASFSQSEFDTLRDRTKLLGIEIKSVKQMRRVYKRAFIGADILDEDDGQSQEGFSYHCITGKRNRNTGTWYGLVRAMKDPQRWANKWLSQTLHIMNSNAKGGLLAERDAFDNVAQAEETWAAPDAITWLRPDALIKGKVKEKPPAQFPAGFYQITEFAISAIRDCTGVNLEILGMREADQAGVLEYQRRQAGMTILATLFDSLRRYRKRQGRYMLDLIQKYLSDGRLIRISGDMGKQYVPLRREEGVVTYDVIVDDSPSAPNQKEQTWQILMQMLPMLKDMMTPPVLLEFLKVSPLPESMVQKIAELAQPRPDPMAEAAKQFQVQQLGAEVDKTQAEAELARAKAQGEGMKLPLEQMKIEGVRAKTEADMVKATMDIQKSQMDAQLAREQGGLKAQQMAQQNEMAQQKHQLGLQQAAQQGSMAQEKHAMGLETMKAKAAQPQRPASTK